MLSLVFLVICGYWVLPSRVCGFGQPGCKIAAGAEERSGQRTAWQHSYLRGNQRWSTRSPDGEIFFVGVGPGAEQGVQPSGETGQ